MGEEEEILSEETQGDESMKQWKFNLFAAILLLPCGMAALRYLKEIQQMVGMIVFLLGFYAAVSGLYFYVYQRDRELEA
jgi:hypothetical protein